MSTEGEDAMELDEEPVPNAQLIVNEELSKSLLQCDLDKRQSDGDEVAPALVSDIIDLVEKRAPRGNTKCINYACSSGADMMPAPPFCLRYYRVKSDVKKQREICRECFTESLVHYDSMCGAMLRGDCLFALNAEAPLRDDLVEIDDSDSEAEEEEGTEKKPGFGDDERAFLKQNLDEILAKTLLKLKCGEQLDRGVDFVQTQIDKMDANIKELDETFRSLSKGLDTVQDELYTQFKSSYKQLRSVDINDDYTSDDFTAKVAKAEEQRDEGERRSVRRIQKPASYADVGDARKTVTAPLTSLLNKQIRVSKDGAPLPPNLPPVGPVVKPTPKIGDLYYAVRFSALGSWAKARLLSVVPPNSLYDGMISSQMMYLVSFELTKQNLRKYLTGKELAYSFPSSVRLEVGTRVVAIFKEISNGTDAKKVKRDAFYPGIVAEPLSSYNNYRYLIFFDDGYAQYVKHDSVYLVLESSKDVWEDMHVDCRQFIKKYLEMYPERPMVKLMKDQSVRTEYNGRWWITTVINIDCSLVQMFFDSTSRIEWIYRGSTRLNPMFKEEQAASNRLQNKTRQSWKSNNTKSDSPYVQYTRGGENEAPQPHTASTFPALPPGMQSRSVAKKSTVPKPLNSNSNSNQSGGAVPFLPLNNNNQHTVQLPPPSKIVYYTPREQLNTKAIYKPHNCSPKCKDYVTYNLSKLNGYNPLSKPLLCGWNRIIIRHKGKKEVVYKTPCARYIRNMDELHRYLRMSKSDMTVDLFDFDYYVRCLAEYVLEPNIMANKDLSAGVEQVPIPVVNYVDNDKLNFSYYSNKREPKEGVDLNLDSNFLCGCDCEDDCRDKSKCACWQLTLQGSKYMPKDEDGEPVGGYIYRRLLEPVITGIYECNSRCKCGKTCLNRVVQNPLSMKLQVFKTNNRGWGIRCLNDMPQGAFVCVYVGDLLTEQMANEGGLNYGDEYLAELDYIEAVETFKEDYEADPYDEKDTRENSDDSSEASRDEDEDEEKGEYRRRNRVPIEEQDNDFVPSALSAKKLSESRMNLRLRRREEKENAKTAKEKEKEKPKPKPQQDDTVYISDDDEDPRELSSFNPKTSSNLDDSKNDYPCVRKLFGEEECVYIMDAKTKGNIGRFLNHSCSPNIFVQNVFVDTHDLRFPWIAFFSLQYIRAGTELTWNYNYDIGSVPGKVLYCRCASAECKGRLL